MARGPKGKPVKRAGLPVCLWRYRDLSIIRRQELGEPRGPLDKGDLSLQPVIVSPHIRWQRGRAVIIDAYGSHRWKRAEDVLGDNRRRCDRGRGGVSQKIKEITGGTFY